MLKGMKRVGATFAAPILLAASTLIAMPVSAQVAPETADNYSYGCQDITTGGYGYGYGHGCCYYDEAWGGWYIMYATHFEPCTPPYGAPEIDDGASRETAGQ